VTCIRLPIRFPLEHGIWLQNLGGPK